MAWLQTIPTGIITSIRSYVEKKTETTTVGGVPTSQDWMRVRVTCVIEFRGMNYTASRQCVLGTGTIVGNAVAYKNGSDEWEMQPIGAGGWNAIRTVDWSPQFTWTLFTANVSFTIP